jgi:hypothetical protein
MEKTDARVRAEFYPSEPQGKKSDNAFLGFLCDEFFFTHSAQDYRKIFGC